MQTNEVQPISDTNLFGASEIDGIYMGGNCALAVTFKEWNDTTTDAMWPFEQETSSKPNMGYSGYIGRCASDLGGALNLKPRSGPALSTPPSNRRMLFAPKATVLPGHTLDIPIGLAERAVGMVFKLWPTQIAVPNAPAGSQNGGLYWYVWNTVT